MTLNNDDNIKISGLGGLELPDDDEEELDTSSDEIIEDGSMSEPSFSSDEDIEELDLDTDGIEPSDISGDEIIDDDNDILSSEMSDDEDDIFETGDASDVSDTSSNNVSTSIEKDEVPDKKNTPEASSKEESKESDDKQENAEKQENKPDSKEKDIKNGDTNSEKREDSIPPKKKDTDDDKNKSDKNDKDDKKNSLGKKPTNNDKEQDKQKIGEASKDKAKQNSKGKASDVKDAAKDKAKDGAKDAAKSKAAGAAKSAAGNAAGGKGSMPTKIPQKKSEAMRMGLDAAAASGNGYVVAAQKVVNIMDKLIGKERVDWILDKLGDRALKHTLIALVLGIIHAIIPIFLIILGVYMLFAPLLDTLVAIDQGVRKVADTAEKFKNLFRNGIYADSKTAFYEEFENLANIYGDQLDQPLLLSATFYADMKNGYQTRYDNISDIIADNLTVDQKDSFVSSFFAIISDEIESISQESNETYDPETGLIYSVGKVYRLRSLAKHMFGDEVVAEPMSLREWINKFGIRLTATLKETIIKMASRLAISGLATVAAGILIGLGVAGIITGGVILKTLGVVAVVAGAIIAFVAGSETLRAMKDIKDDLDLLFQTGYLGLMSLKSMHLSFDDDENELFAMEEPREDDQDYEEKKKEYDNSLKGLWELLLDRITIDLYTPKFDDDTFKKYLRNTYIPENPDFAQFLTYDAGGTPTRASIERVVNEIYDYRTYFKELFYPEEEDYSETYSEQCVGAIDKRLAATLALPTDINTTNCIDFSGNNGFGYTANGLLHDGIELNANSTGNTEGDKVYSVMDNGTVKGSSADGTMECIGGCIEIEYDVSATGLVPNSEYHFSIVYKGLSKDSVTLKTGDTVTKRQQIGTIGSAAESENMGIPSLYLEFRNKDGMAIDPTNLIVKCKAGGVPEYEDSTAINVPQTFNQTKYHTVTCFGGKGFYHGRIVNGKLECPSTYYNKETGKQENNNSTWGIGSGQRAVFKLWERQGGKYKNGIAIINVDGVDRYLVAVTKTIGNVGDIINARYDGKIVPMIIMDEKNAKDKNMMIINGVPWGHKPDPDKYPNLVNIVEMEVDPNVFNNLHDNVRTSNWGVEWDTTQPIMSFSNSGSILVKNSSSETGYDYSDKFDLSGTGSGSANTGGATTDGNEIAGNGLRLCSSMGTGNSSKIEKYTAEAMSIANNDEHGYSQTNRNLDPDVDCSSLVYYSLVNSGVMPAQSSGAFTTYTMGDILKSNGFDELTYSKDSLQKGDIVVFPGVQDDHTGHTVIYLGDNKQVAANGCNSSTDHPNRSCNSGDQADEVSVADFYDSGNYTKIYRIKYDPNDSGSGDPNLTRNPGTGSEVTKYTKKDKTIDVVTVKTAYKGGPRDYASMLKTNGIRQNLYPIVNNNGQQTRKYKWSGCCRGVAKTQACGYMRGASITLESVESRFNSKETCDNNPPECSSKFKTKHCFATEAEMTQHVIKRINEGKITILHVTTGKITGYTKEQYNKRSEKTSRHFLMAVGYVKDSDPTDSLNLLYIDSFNAEYGRIGERMYILRTDKATYNKDTGCSSEKPYHVIDYD